MDPILILIHNTGFLWCGTGATVVDPNNVICVGKKPNFFGSEDVEPETKRNKFDSTTLDCILTVPVSKDFSCRLMFAQPESSPEPLRLIWLEPT